MVWEGIMPGAPSCPADPVPTAGDGALWIGTRFGGFGRCQTRAVLTLPGLTLAVLTLAAALALPPGPARADGGIAEVAFPALDPGAARAAPVPLRLALAGGLRAAVARAPAGSDLTALQVGAILQIDRFFTRDAPLTPAELTAWAALLDDLTAHHRDSDALAHRLLALISAGYLALAAGAPDLADTFARRHATELPAGGAWSAELFEIRLANAALDLADTHEHHAAAAVLYDAVAALSELTPGLDDTRLFDYRQAQTTQLALAGDCVAALATYADLPATRMRRPTADDLARIGPLRALIDCFDMADPLQARSLRHELLRLLELGAAHAAQVSGGDTLHRHQIRIAEVLIDLGERNRAVALLLEAMDRHRAQLGAALSVHDVVARAVLGQLRRAAPDHPAIPELSALAGERMPQRPAAAAGGRQGADSGGADSGGPDSGRPAPGGHDDDRLIRSMNVAQMLFMQGQWFHAEGAQRVVIDMLRSLPETSGPMGLAVNLDLLATMVSAQGRFLEAVDLRREALLRAGRGDPDFRLALARDLATVGQQAEAGALLLDLLEDQRARAGADSRSQIDTLRGLVALHDGPGEAADPAAARHWRHEIRRILALQADLERSRPSRPAPPSPMSVPHTLLDLAAVTAELGDTDAAAGLLIEAVESWRAHHGDANAYTRFTAHEVMRRLAALDPDHPALPGLRQAFPGDAAGRP